MWAWAAVASAHHTLVLDTLSKHALAFTAGFGPVIAAIVISAVFRGKGGTSMFDSKQLVGSLAQWAVGSLFCGWSVYYACLLAL